MSGAIPILIYHQISPQSHPAFRKYTVTPAAFAQQMRWLAMARYTPITLDTLDACRREPTRLPARPVVITFDDGYRDWLEYAVPTLHARNFTAVFYLVAGLLGRTSAWLLPERGIEFPLFDAAAARQLAEQGFQCASHTLTHPHLAALSIANCRDELVGSRMRLEDILGHEVRHLAYPYGSFNHDTLVITREAGYITAVTGEIGLSLPDEDPLRLRRIPITGFDSLPDFVSRLRTGLTVKETAIRAGGDLRRRLRRRGENVG